MIINDNNIYILIYIGIILIILSLASLAALAWSNLTLVQDKECDYQVSRQDRIDDYSNRLGCLRIQNAEEYNIVKIKMETDVQVTAHTGVG